MKKILFLLLTLSFVAGACNSSRKAEAERKKTKEKMDELDKNKQDFEMRNPK